jgi:hypothetical protein
MLSCALLRCTVCPCRLSLPKATFAHVNVVNMCTVHCRTSPICFVALRKVVFCDGHAYFSWCTNPGCSAHYAKNGLVCNRIFSAAHPFEFAESELTEKFPDPEARTCSCARAAMCTVASNEERFADYADELGDIGASMLATCSLQRMRVCRLLDCVQRHPCGRTFLVV